MKIEQIQHGTILVLVPNTALIEEEVEDFLRAVRQAPPALLSKNDRQTPPAIAPIIKPPIAEALINPTTAGRMKAVIPGRIIPVSAAEAV